MSKSTIGPHAPSKTQSQYCIEPSEGGIFFEKKGAIASLILGLTACGGGGGGGGGSTTSNTPINTIPVSASSYIELGPIAGGTVSFQTLSGSVLSTGGTRSDGSLDYSPRDIISKIGNDQWLIVNVSGGRDTDVDDDGVTDAVSTPLLGSFRMLVPRSALESGEKIVVNPRSGMISELLLAKNTPITLDSLNIAARQSGAEDQNNDGILDYKDTYSVRMKDVTGVSKIVPMTSGYIASIHSGNAINKMVALSNVARTENHIIARIIPANDPNDHAPSLELTTSTPGATILYTLDLSSPVPGGATTRSASARLVVPFQNTKIYYREYTTINGQTVLGKVAGFDLISDWTELAHTSVPYNNSGRVNTNTESSTYKNIPYFITTTSNDVLSGYTYPKTITCNVGTQKDAGCHQGPYMIWSPEHESRVRDMIITAVKAYIDIPNTTSPVITPPVTNPNTPIVGLTDTVRNNISYNGAVYTIKNIWTLGANNTKVFPVVIDIVLNRKNGQLYTTTRTVNTQPDLTYYNTQLELSIREYIDSDTAVKLIPPTYSQNHAVSYTNRVNNYYGGFYEVFNTYNLDGKSDFPVQISGIYGVQNQGTKTPAIMMAANETERIQKSNQMLVDIQRIIQAGYSVTPAPTYSQNYLVPSSFVSYRGYGYQLLTTMNISGTSDYPASVRVIYTTPLSNNNTTQTINANSASELASVQAERINDAKARIDLIVNADQYSQNHVEVMRNSTSYGGGSYYTTFTYSGNPGQDYPGYVDVYRTFRNAGQDRWTFQVDNANEKNTVAALGEAKAREDIDNYNPSYSANYVGSDGPYLYGNKGSEYTYKVKYNRVGNGANYPALVWIEYKSRSTGQILDTRNIYGNMYASSSVEKEQIKATLTNFVKGQMIAMNPSSPDTMLATKWKISDLLPISTAHAATPYTGLLVQKNYVQLPGFSPIDPKTNFGKFFAGGNMWDHFVRNEVGKGGVAANVQSELEKKINDRITDIMDKYATDGTIYLGDLPDAVIPVMTAIFTDVINKKSANEIYTKYKQQLTALGVTVETMAKMHGNILIVASEGLSGTQEVYPENYFFGAKALFGLGKIGINMIINKATGKILAQSIVGQGGTEFMKYESRVVSGKVIFSDAAGRIYKLENNNIYYGFGHIFKARVEGEISRALQIIRSTEVQNFFRKTFGKDLDSFGDFEKLIGYIIKNGKYIPVNKNGNIEYSLDIGGKFLKIISQPGSNSITTISF